MDHQKEAGTAQLRNFGLVLGALFALFFGLLPRLTHRDAMAWPWAIAGVLWLGALVQPESLRYVHRAWIILGLALGWLNTKILLTLIFMISVAPLGFVNRLLGRDRIGKNFNPSGASYRVLSRPRPAESLKKPY